MSWTKERPSRPGLYWWRFEERRGMASFQQVQRASRWNGQGSDSCMVLHTIKERDGELRGEEFFGDDWDRVEWFGEPVLAPSEAIYAPL